MPLVNDISEHKLAEEEIEKHSETLERMVKERTKELNRALYDMERSRDRIDAILKSISDGLIVTDIHNRIILMNPAVEELLGVRFSEVIDRPIDFAIHDKTLKDRIKDALEKKKTDYQFYFEISNEETNQPRVMRARTSGIKDKAGNHTGIITIIHDVTHEREIERMKTEFLSMAAHELRTPLTSIQGFSEILLTRDDINKKKREKYLTYINDQSMNLASLLNDFLDISRIESSLEFSLKKAPCNLADIISSLVRRFQEQTSKHYFEVVLPEESAELTADKEKMEQVLQELLDHAVKYSPEGGLIRVKGELIQNADLSFMDASPGFRNSGLKHKNVYLVSIQDEGKGMIPDQVEKIFDKFYRGDVSDTAIPGTGLGMSIVKYIVEAHGGKIWVESGLGKGTTVRFTIPT